MSLVAPLAAERLDAGGRSHRIEHTMNSILRILVATLRLVAYALVDLEAAFSAQVMPQRVDAVVHGSPTPSSVRMLGWLSRRWLSPPDPRLVPA